jgi:predicted dehydrogenase
LRVGIVGCGLIGHKRAEALGGDELVGSYDIDPARALDPACASLDELLSRRPDVVIVATTHDTLAELSIAALEAGAHVLVEKPAGMSRAQVMAVKAAAERAGRLVKVGFNHRFHPGIARAVTEARSGAFGEILHLRARYGHGGRPGYESEWRADPARSGGGELIDQGMHLLDLSHWLLGELPLHSALLRTAYWDMPVEDNAVLLLGERSAGPWASLHVSWSEWKNLFSLEIYCRTAKLQVDGLVRSYGPQRLTRYLMKPELGPPDVDVIDYPPEDSSWKAEWLHFRTAINGAEPISLLGSLDSAAYAWSSVEAAYACR